MKCLAVAAALLISSISLAPDALSYNPPGPGGGAGHGKYWHRNPKGPAGGPGRGWVYNPPGKGKIKYCTTPNNNIHANPPGPVGGAGHGRYWHYNPAGALGGPGQGWVHNPPGPGKTIYR